jgi:hypothetical protein
LNDIHEGIKLLTLQKPNVALVTSHLILDQNLFTVFDVFFGSTKLTATGLTDAELLSHPMWLDPAPAEMIRFPLQTEMLLLYQLARFFLP